MKPVAHPPVRIGCAGWSLATRHQLLFPQGGSHLERYAQVFNAVEINSSFYRPHRPATYRKWAGSVPADFRFSAKIPRAISHDAKLIDAGDLLREFLDEVMNLGSNLGCLLLQLPPSLAFTPEHLGFFDEFGALYAGPVVCEPRHVSWFTPAVDAALRERRVGRAAADPALTVRAHVPGGYRGLEYVRLHGSPHIYYDAYSTDALAVLGRRIRTLRDGGSARWVIFDNTAAGHATLNALELQRIVAAG
jgi:uncharacterized protein YecE (DUF72 family)